MRTVAHDLLQQPTPHASTRGSWATDSRRLIRPEVIATIAGFEPDDIYIRRFWVAAIGSGAVEDLLRMVIAGRRNVAIAEPCFLPTLILEGLAHAVADRIQVPDPIPALGPTARMRLRPSLRSEHARHLLARRPPADRSSTR